MSPTHRDKVAKLAKTDPQRALHVTRDIPEPWFRAQALAHVVRYTTGDPGRIAKEAAQAASLCDDDCKRTAVRAWEIAALAERGDWERARATLMQTLRQAASVEPPASRSEALSLLLHAATRINLDAAVQVAHALRAVFAVGSHWRCTRAVKDATAVLTSMDRKVAEDFAAGIGDEKTRAACRKTIAEGGMAARPFFW